MKILITNHFPFFGSGSGIYVANIAKKLEKHGHEVCIITPENTCLAPIFENIKVHPVYFKYEQEIENQLDFNFPCFDPHPRSSLRFFNMTKKQEEEYVKAFKQAIEEEIKKFKPDIIHAQHIWIISSIAVEYGIPVVITSHGSDVFGYEQETHLNKYADNAAEKSKRIIAISNHNEFRLKELFPENKDKIVKLLNGYSTDVFYRRNYNKSNILKKYNIDKDYDKVVCFAGRLNENKGIDILLRAAKIYEKENIITLIVGYGEEYSKLVKLKEKLNLQNVIFLKYQDQDALREIYNISDVSVVPSREEAFGLVALESLACGTPVIATNQGGIPDFVNDKVGRLIEVDDYETLAKNVKEILNGEIAFQREELSKYARTNYSEDILIGKLIEIYEKIIEEN